ncbi:hypothetical protein M407DRAFT_26199 [Tulasnella calospora MUT 4182]|uniref:Uncharacterized protein n=1 Tax=Tulasnella calospora MUT 4182 TaxID=1051891 RepID=A0A0C3KSH2_9AGAM|nr:hypothetical protein M407DRAFT_26199 [Tulasnella calospora MUT 4182]
MEKSVTHDARTEDRHSSEYGLEEKDPLRLLDLEQQCSWGDQPTRKRFLQSSDEELLDELGPPGEDRALGHIGRAAEYHVSVFAHDQVIQNLTYASYGSNSIDTEMQYHWHRTPDNLYHQPTPDGSLLMFKTDGKETFRSFIILKYPIVHLRPKRNCVRVSIAERSEPLLLGQPKPALYALYPSRLKKLRELSKQDEITWVGRVGNSLYALSHNTFPLVIFSQLPTLPSIRTSLKPLYKRVCTTLDCLTGPNRTETATMSRLSRLIAGSESTDPGQSAAMPRFDVDDEDFEEEDRPASSRHISNWRPTRTMDRWRSRLEESNPHGIIRVSPLGMDIRQASNRDLEKKAREPVSLVPPPAPSPEEVGQAVVPQEVIESKPLPPVPVPDLAVDVGEGDKTVIVDEPKGDDNGDDAGTEKEVEDTKGGGGKKKGPKRRKSGKGGKKVTIAEPVKNETGDSEPPELDFNIVITPPRTPTPHPPRF